MFPLLPQSFAGKGSLLHSYSIETEIKAKVCPFCCRVTVSVCPIILRRKWQWKVAPNYGKLCPAIISIGSKNGREKMSCKYTHSMKRMRHQLVLINVEELGKSAAEYCTSLLLFILTVKQSNTSIGSEKFPQKPIYLHLKLDGKNCSSSINVAATSFGVSK